ncbi:KAP family P-loop NTPase fold protein [Profundibacter amoris]|uniref:KAP NTPase domain-containing protein n=1 Tax=Profundibacter amoris TaxID=2171755 RepID=A0A347UDR5_9RHOB|nr:P-loop NTPase fold protein [Profundibacter amoris]AXX96993.1 hypothetical protein BAR1_03035 [Profundibacter amoris]
MRLTIKEPDIDIGKDGFDKHCQLGRAKTGKVLSELVEKTEDPIVIALDGSWGSGKSFFLKCWTGAHTNENDGKAKVIYFDAFEHDYLVDPLIALTGVLSDQFDPNSKAGKAIGAAKKAVSKVWRPATRIGLAAATAGVSEIAGAVGDAVVASSNEELSKASENFWKKEDGRRAAMKEFRTALRKLTEPDNDGIPQKIVIIIDELDRCRPDYALTMLEVIKHFFAVDNVHFVLGVNLNELQNSVRSRYGAEIDAGKYLQKFINVKFSVEGDKWNKYNKGSFEYFKKLAETQGLTEDQYLDFINCYLENMPPDRLPNLRSCERLVTSAILAPARNKLAYRPDAHILAGLLIMESIDPDTAVLAREGELPFETVQKTLGLRANRTVPDPSFLDEAINRWSFCLEEDLNWPENDQRASGWPPAQTNNRGDIVPRLAGLLWGTIRTLDIE